MAMMQRASTMLGRAIGTVCWARAARPLGGSSAVRVYSSASRDQSEEAKAKEEEEHDSPYNPQPPDGLVPSFAYNLNFSFTHYPLTSLVTMPVLDMTTVGTAYALVWLSGMIVPPELAVAVAISRVLRRFRLPLELANAAMLVRIFPPLSKVNVTALSNVVPGTTASFMPTQDGAVGRAVHKLLDKINQYGIGYFLSARYTGLAITSALYIAIRLGVDIDPLLSLVGTHKDQLAHVLGTYAAALTASAAFYPISLTLTGIIVPRVGRNVEAPFRESMLRRLSRGQ